MLAATSVETNEKQGTRYISWLKYQFMTWHRPNSQYKIQMVNSDGESCYIRLSCNRTICIDQSAAAASECSKYNKNYFIIGINQCNMPWTDNEKYFLLRRMSDQTQRHRLPASTCSKHSATLASVSATLINRSHQAASRKHKPRSEQVQFTLQFLFVICLSTLTTLIITKINCNG